MAVSREIFLQKAASYLLDWVFSIRLDAVIQLVVRSNYF